jgi:murein DD-endopeptidase MepM/ murein hydrolase activator NlpD
MPATDGVGASMSYQAGAHYHHGERQPHAGEQRLADAHRGHEARVAHPRARQHDHDDQEYYLQQRHDARHPRAQRDTAPKQRIAAGDYTLIHRGKLVRAGPVAFWTIVGTLVVMAGWTLVTVTYFAFQDDVLTRLIARQAEMQYAYEDRIADMRAQVDRVTSRQLLDQEQVENKLDLIAKRQATLEQRTNTLGNLGGDVTGSIKPNGRDHHKPSPIGDGASLQPRGFSAIVAKFTGRSGGGLNGTLARLQDSLEKVEARQTATLMRVEENYSARAKRIRSALAEIGVNPGKAPPEATGGPFVPVKPGDDSFAKQIQRIGVARAHMERLNKTLVAIPLRQPLPGELDQSSGFGIRADPFLGRAAMHTGLDFRADTGDPVRATAAGTVTVAGWQGGYGKMVEIDHGNGLATRYGHLSSIGVREGQSVRPGQIVGHVGSTGRSTGPHLHYETRVDGEAVSPTKFLRVGSKLGLAQ